MQAPPAAAAQPRRHGHRPDLSRLLTSNKRIWRCYGNFRIGARIEGFGSVTRRRNRPNVGVIQATKSQALIHQEQGTLNPEIARWCPQSQTQLLGVTNQKSELFLNAHFCSQAGSNPATVKIGSTASTPAATTCDQPQWPIRERYSQDPQNQYPSPWWLSGR